MGLSMKNFHILGVNWNIEFLEGTHEKKQYRGGLPKKEGLGHFVDLKGGGLGKKEGWWCFWGGGGDTPMQTMKLAIKTPQLHIFIQDFTSFSIVSTVNFQQVIHPR